MRQRFIHRSHWSLHVIFRIEPASELPWSGRRRNVKTINRESAFGVKGWFVTGF